MSISAGAFDTLTLENVGRSFGGQVALQGLDLEIASGEFIALLGPSGCGKSTALNCLAGLLPLTHGQIMIDGERVDTLASERRGFGMVFQNYALFPHLSVAKNVGFGLAMRKVPRAEAKRRVAEAIELVKLGEHANKLPGQLSGGQQQRVAIARAIVLEPRLVLMDEPLSNLDAKLRLEMRTEIRKLHQSLGLTTFYVTHDQEEALSMADRLVVLRDGRVQQVGTPQQLHSSPVNWHVADFMGYRNIQDVTVERVETGTTAQQSSTAQGGSQAQVGERRPATVTGNELQVAATAVGDLQAGDSARLAIRPEDLSILPPGEQPSSGNAIEATVAVVEYHGREFNVGVTTGSGATWHVLSESAPAPGDEVTLTVAPERALVFKVDLDPSQLSDTERDLEEARQ